MQKGDRIRRSLVQAEKQLSFQAFSGRKEKLTQPSLPALYAQLDVLMSDDGTVLVQCGDWVSDCIIAGSAAKTEGTFPSSISGALKDPKTQFSKEFEDSATGPRAKVSLAAAVEAAQKSYLKVVIATKHKELEILQGSLKFSHSDWEDIVQPVSLAFTATVGATFDNVSNKWSSNMSEDLIQQVLTLGNQGQSAWYKVITLAHASSQQELHTLVDDRVHAALQSFFFKQKTGKGKGKARTPPKKPSQSKVMKKTKDEPKGNGKGSGNKRLPKKPRT
ncbi:MAG: hypothetical protein FRX48_01140 [Lasallia pustulata]|uniref:Uncharacterized protein n=1 Tax=Lasallia pustulata TaxID=136370 RepID=A0A5M8PXF4_9LECA|nr:MAG: hypothetical protein FRX48_01140 [Lasallia pustulata]